MTNNKKYLMPEDSPGVGAGDTEAAAREREREAVQKNAGFPGTEENAAGKKGTLTTDKKDNDSDQTDTSHRPDDSI